MSNRIWDEVEEYDDQPQEEYVEEYQEYAEPEPDYYPQQASQSPLNDEVLRRIQRAKLYETLLNHQMFEGGDADPESIQEVEDELKAFIVSRIEVLMGIRQEGNAEGFSSNEVHALKIVARKLLGETQQEAPPAPPPRQTPPPQRQPQPRQQVQPRPAQVRRPAPPPPPREEPGPRMVQVRQRVPRTNVPSRSVRVGQEQPQRPLRKTLPRRPKSGNVSSTGQDLSQARPTTGALPMPSPEAINMHTIAQAEAVMASGKSNVGNEPINLGQIVKSLK